MIAKLTVIFLIILFLQLGFLLVLWPWVSFGAFGNWNDNYLLALAVEQTGMPGLRSAVSSGWFRGAVSGLGAINLIIAFWEIAHFNESVALLEGRRAE
jgi:hypothetical protein